MQWQFWKNLLLDNPLIDILDIVVVAFVLYQCFLLIEGTRAQILVQGIFVVLLVKVFSGPLGLNEIQWFLETSLPVGFLGLVVLFQAELRRGLEQLGRGFHFKGLTNNGRPLSYDKDISEILGALEAMQERQTGALLVFESTVGLREYYEFSAPISSDISKELIHTIFFKDTPLHDGAMIIKGNSIICASVYLPLSQNPNVGTNLGTRHRAALGVTEVSDALVLIVSEERGEYSIAQNGKIQTNVSHKRIKEALHKYYGSSEWSQSETSELQEEFN